MPLKVDPKDRMLLLGAGCVLVLMIAGAASFSGAGENQGEVPSSYSTASGGAKAAYLLLADAGYRVERWERPLDQLPRATGTTLILAEPSEAPTHEEKDRLKAFIAQGGHVIAIGTAVGAFLPENDAVPEFDVLGEIAGKKASALSPSEITRAAPEIVIAPRAHWQSDAAAYPLYGDGDRTLVVKYAYGRGEVLWWASATPLTNAGLKEQGNLEFFLACLGGARGGILWDEYIHGYRQTLGLSIAHSPAKWLALQLVLLGLAVVATFSRRSGPICEPASEVRLSPIEFVQTLGGLYETARTASVAVDICYQRFRYWLTRRLGVASNISVADLELAARDRWAFVDEHFVGVLRRCESARSDPYLHPPVALQLVQELDEFAVRLKLFQGARKEKG
jgi:hypothetical protein